MSVTGWPFGRVAARIVMLRGKSEAGDVFSARFEEDLDEASFQRFVAEQGLRVTDGAREAPTAIPPAPVSASALSAASSAGDDDGIELF